MFPTSIEFKCFKKGGDRTWALRVRLDKGDWWVIKRWKNEPAVKTVEELEDLVLRSMQIYHKSIKIPSFNL